MLGERLLRFSVPPSYIMFFLNVGSQFGKRTYVDFQFAFFRVHGMGGDIKKIILYGRYLELKAPNCPPRPLDVPNGTS